MKKSKNIKRILITGGAGYLGNTLINLLSENIEIVVIDNFHIDTLHKRLVNSELQKTRKMTLINANVSEVEKYREVLSDIDIVLYMASLNSLTESDKNPELYMQENNLNLQIFLNVLSKYSPNLKKIILTSTRGVYGEGSYLCLDCGNRNYPELSEHLKCSECRSQNIIAQSIKETDIVKPTSIYGLTKKIQEDLLSLYCIKRKIPLDIFRIFNVYGEGQEKYYSHIGIIPRMYHQIITNSEITLCGSGKLTRDFIDVRVVANVLCKSILNMNPKKDFIEIYNLGSGIGISLNDISDVFVKKGYVFKEKKLKEFNDIKYSIAENSKLIKAFGIKEFNNVLVFLEKLYPAI